MESSSCSGSSKRAKTTSHSSSSYQVAHCLVDGCNADLSLCRDYHRRHKVCEVHSKTAKVTIGGREQRFCQQCSRFHSLVEFDEGKRSCRKRLDGHNRRRRKPQLETLPRNSGILFSNHSQSSILGSGTRMLSFGSPQVLPSSAVSWPWPGIVKTENDIALFWRNGNQQMFERPEPFLNYKGLVDGSSSSSSSAVFSEGPNHRALSLLSLAPEATEEFSLVHNEAALHNAQLGDQEHNALFHHHHNPPGHHASSSSSCGSHQKMSSFLWK